MRKHRFLSGLAALLVCASLPLSAPTAEKSKAAQPLIRSARTGSWSAPATWEGGKVPGTGDRVQVREGHTVTYDAQSDQVIRFIHVAGTLTFARDRDTLLNVGLILIQPGSEATETGFDCDAHVMELEPGQARPALEIGTRNQPLAAKHTALIRLHYIAGMDKESCPAIVCCGGRWDMHGAPMNRTWVDLGATANKGDTKVTLAEAVTGWKVGDRLLVTATKGTHDTGGTRRPGGDQDVYTEERVIRGIDGTEITLDRPLTHEHLGTGDFRGEVANLSRNVIVESAEPEKGRGHTMYHRGSAGSLTYAEFRHLGKERLLGRYALHFHLVGDTMRGSSVVGVSIWDSANRWLTIHGTNYLVVRDCVGYQSVGHGYFLEDGTEVFNVLDRNLAVQAYRGKRLPKQVLPFDHNEGAGFWWANSLNSFTRNVAVENDTYGFRFEATQSSSFKLTLPILQADGSRKRVDIRTLPFIRFDDNECHCDGRYGVNIGEGVNHVGPDVWHPFIVRNLKIWEVHYAFRPQSPSLLVENMHIHKADYGIYHPNYDNHVYRNLTISETNTEPFNRGHDDDSEQYGPLVVDGLTFDGIRSSVYMPLVQISDDNPTGLAVTHLRDVKVTHWTGDKRKAIINLGGGPRPTPQTAKGVPIYVHDWFGPGQHALVVSTRSPEYKEGSQKYEEVKDLTGNESRAARVKKISFPDPLVPRDDLPPATIITQVIKTNSGKLLVRGTTADNGEVRRVLVNGQQARSTERNFMQWEVELLPKQANDRLQAAAEDVAGNRESLVHTISLSR